MRIAIAVVFVAVGCSNHDDCDRNVRGNVCTIAGQGPMTSGYSGDEGPGVEAQLSLPIDTLTASNGTTYILDWNNHRIRSLTPDGIMHHVAGDAETGGSVDDPTTSMLNHPTGMLFDADESHIAIAGWHTSRVSMLDLATGVVTHSCGNGTRNYTGDEGLAIDASLNLPVSLARSPAGDLMIMDQENQVIRRVDATGTIHRFAGSCVVDVEPPEGPGPCAQPVACPGSDVTTCGDPATTCRLPCWPSYAGEEVAALELRMAQPYGAATDPGGRLAYDAAGDLYFSDPDNQAIRMIDTQGIVHRVAAGELDHPTDLAFGDDGTLYIADTFAHCVRALVPDGTVQTVAGWCGHKGYSGDGAPATDALLNRPYGVEWVAPDTLIIADTGNSVIRAVRL